MFRDSRPIALRKLMPFSNSSGGRKHRTSDIESDEDPLLDEEAAVK
jgi:phospholipid-translocating ATPase